MKNTGSPRSYPGSPIDQLCVLGHIIPRYLSSLHKIGTIAIVHAHGIIMSALHLAYPNAPFYEPFISATNTQQLHDTLCAFVIGLMWILDMVSCLA